MEGVFWFIFGAVVGGALVPHFQRIANEVRGRLAGLDQPKDLSPRP